MKVYKKNSSISSDKIIGSGSARMNLKGLKCAFFVTHITNLKIKVISETFAFSRSFTRKFPINLLQ